MEPVGQRTGCLKIRTCFIWEILPSYITTSYAIYTASCILLQIFWSAAARAAGSSKKICNNTEKIR